MDNFKKPKKHSAGSVDGFIQPSAFGSQQPASLRAFDKHYRGKHKASAEDLSNLRIGKVDDFNSANGFSPSSIGPISQPGAANKPAELGEVYKMDAEEKRILDGEQPHKKKRGFLHFRRHKKEKKVKHHSKYRRLMISLRVMGAMALLLILVGGALGLKTYFKSRNIFKGGGTGAAALNKTVDPTLLKGEGDGRVNVLLLGKGGAGHDGPDLTDTLLVASIDPVAKEVALLSVPRDLWVRAPSGGQSKINAVYANAKYGVLNNYTTKNQTDTVKKQAETAGIRAIETTITNTLGIPLHYYAMVDFTAFKQAIDAVGGVDINVSTQLYDPNVAWENNNNPLIAAVGLQHFNGAKALLYARSREGSARGDFDRTERQREIMTALKTKVLSLGTFANPLKLNQLLDAFGDHVTTDFALNELMRVYDIIKNVDSTKIQSIGLADPPNNFVTTGTVNNQSVVLPRAGQFDYTAIQSYVRNTLRDPYLKSENANVVILNGTDTAGLATLKSTELKSYGYNVTLVADAPTKTYAKTILVDMTKGIKKYTKNYLQKRLGVTAITSLPDPAIVPGTADFVIILGSNESAAQ